MHSLPGRCVMKAQNAAARCIFAEHHETRNTAAENCVVCIHQKAVCVCVCAGYAHSKRLLAASETRPTGHEKDGSSYLVGEQRTTSIVKQGESRES